MKTLVKEHGLFQGTIDPENNVIMSQFADGYEELATTVFVSKNYFDLAGMSQEDKTLFFEGATVQNLANPSFSVGTAGDSVGVIDIMSAIPLSDTELVAYFNNGNFASNSGPTFEQTQYARYTYHVIDIDFAAAGYFNTMFSNQIGSLEPTASDRIYTYRLIGIGDANTVGQIISVFPCRYILRADAKEEAEYQHLMRLKRSYDTQQRFDRD